MPIVFRDDCLLYKTMQFYAMRFPYHSCREGKKKECYGILEIIGYSFVGLSPTSEVLMKGAPNLSKLNVQ